MVDRDGANATELFEFGPLEPENTYYAVAADDTIVWNQIVHTPGEIWMSAAD